MLPTPLQTLPAEPWKNGGGLTRTLAVHPPGATLTDFLWRISLAEVATSGPFSSFPGIDRTIILWRGHGMGLESAHQSTHYLNQPLQPYTFPGELPIQATLLDGPTTDLNLMLRRGSFTASLLRHNAPTELPPADDLFLLGQTGRINLDLPGNPTLYPEHFLHLTHPGPIQLTPLVPNATLLSISILKTCQAPKSVQYAPIPTNQTK